MKTERGKKKTGLRTNFVNVTIKSLSICSWSKIDNTRSRAIAEGFDHPVVKIH